MSCKAEPLSWGTGSGGVGGWPGDVMSIVDPWCKSELLVLKLLRLEEVNQGHNCIFSDLVGGWSTALPMTMQHDGKVCVCVLSSGYRG